MRVFYILVSLYINCKNEKYVHTIKYKVMTVSIFDIFL